MLCYMVFINFLINIYIMLLLIISCLIYLYLYNRNNVLIFLTIFLIVYFINICCYIEPFELLNIEERKNDDINNKIFEYGSLLNKSFLRINKINFVFNFITDLQYENDDDNKIETFLYPYTNVLGAQVISVNNIKNDYVPKIELLNNFGISLNSNKDNCNICNVIAYGFY